MKEIAKPLIVIGFIYYTINAFGAPIQGSDSKEFVARTPAIALEACVNAQSAARTLLLQLEAQGIVGLENLTVSLCCDPNLKDAGGLGDPLCPVRRP